MTDDTNTTDGAQDADHPSADGVDPSAFDSTGGSPHATAGSSGLLADEGLEDVLPKLYWIGLGLCGLVALATLERFYAHATAAIAELVTPEYVDLFLAGFNLVLLLLAGLAASYLVRRLVGLEETA